MDRNRIAYLIQKLRSGQATQAEVDELEAFWHVANTDRTQFDAIPRAEREEIRRAMLGNIRERISRLDVDDARTRRNSPVLSWSLAVAASVGLILAVAIYVLRTSSGEEHFQTAYGEQLSFTLPDESTVIVNGNSSIHYDNDWNSKQDREVWIEGEAFFDVKHTANDQKFLVHTASGMVVQVLGTRFNVKVRRGKTEVMLETGSVRLDVNKDQVKESMMLVPGELAVLSGEYLLKSQVKAEEYTAWKENKLIFNETPLSDIAVILEDTYGITVAFDDSALMERRLSGEISADNVTDIVTAIEESMGIDIIHEDNRMIFKLKKN